ncbi:MAG: hypothetical protein AB7F86_08870 [Bdellovibrionales bacterium]
MRIRTFLMASIVAVSFGCGKKSNKNNDGAGSACNAATTSLKQMASSSEKNLKSGPYLLSQASLISVRKGQTRVIHYSFSQDEKGQKTEFTLQCPRPIVTGSAFYNNHDENDIAEELTVNADGKVEIPNTFLMQTLQFDSMRGRFDASLKKRFRTSRAEQGVSADEFQKRKEVSVRAVNGGFVLEYNLAVNVSGDTETIQTFYKFVSATNPTPKPDDKPDQPVPRPDPAPKTAEQCLKETGFKLGKYSLENIRFNKDCTGVWVVKGEVTSKLSGIAPSLIREDYCDSNFAEQILNLTFQTDWGGTQNELQKLNPKTQFFGGGLSEGATIHFEPRPEDFGRGTARMIIPGGSENSAYVNGAIAAQVQLRGKAACHFAADVAKVKNSSEARESLKNKLLDLFKVRIQ